MRASVGDTVYLIYIGLVTVQHVDSDGNISFYLYDDETIQTANTAQYRTMDRMDSVRHSSRNSDYTRPIQADMDA